MVNHELKILPEYYKEVLAGKKKFEIRKNDRNFKTEDQYDLWQKSSVIAEKLINSVTELL